MSEARIVIRRKRLVRTLVLITAVLFVLSIAGQAYRFTVGRDRYLVRLFNVDVEYNFPSVFRAMLWLICALLFSYIAWLSARNGLRFRRRWWALAAIFLVLSLDDLMSFHEQLSGPVRALTGARGALYFAWVLPACLAVVVFLAMYIRLFVTLPTYLKTRVAISGGLFVLGALGLEVVSGFWLGAHSIDSLGYSMLVTGEELLEFCGILLLLDSLLLYIGRQFNAPAVTVALEPSESRSQGQ
jgi:hypothetical protein